MSFPGVTLAIVSPVTTDKTDISVQTIIYFGSSASGLVIKFGPLVTFCVLIYSLGNEVIPQIGATTFSFAYIFCYHLMILNYWVLLHHHLLYTFSPF